MLPVSAFEDNYIWLLHDGQRALVVDPGDAEPVLEQLTRQGLSLETILVTHHHPDHVGGLRELQRRTGARIVGPAAEAIAPLDDPVVEPEVRQALGLNWHVLDVPGHTAGHVAYFCEAVALDAVPNDLWPSASLRLPLVFVGDTLFSAGCGRLFEGTPAQMLASLDKLAALPADTVVCCAHEYTLGNLRFAQAVEPNHAALATHVAWANARRQHQQPTVPTPLSMELAINPFLRSRRPQVRAAVAQHEPSRTEPASDADAFASLRRWKNEFR